MEALATVPSRKQQVLDLLTRYHVGWVGTVASIVECFPLLLGEYTDQGWEAPQWYITTSTQLQKPGFRVLVVKQQWVFVERL